MSSTRIVQRPFPWRGVRKRSAIAEVGTRIFTPLIVIFAFAASLGAAPAAQHQGREQPGSKSSASIPVSEFARIVQEFSEEGGYFPADNFTSNETAYLQVTGRLKELGVSGGAYVGVGPEQNFTYIAKIRPSIAFIVDIRRQAVLQHLLYKAIFHHAADRAEFLSWLFSKPLSNDRSETKGSLEDLLQYIYKAPSSQETFQRNLAVLQKTITGDFQIPLSDDDVESLRYIYNVFWRANLRIAYGYGFATLAELILQTDSEGNLGNFLAHDEDFQFVRNLEEQNRVIPLVGDFAGKKALGAVADYLKKNGYSTSAFYTSNVEEYLFGDGVFDLFVANVAKFPVNGHSVLIRSLRSPFAYRHPAALPRTYRMTLLERIPVFLDDFKKGFYPDYVSLVVTHYIAGTEPRPADSTNEQKDDAEGR